MLKKTLKDLNLTDDFSLYKGSEWESACGFGRTAPVYGGYHGEKCVQ